MGEVAAVATAFVFALSAALKLFDRTGTAAGFSELRVPRPPLTVWLVIAAEAIVAVGVLLAPAVGWLAVALLVAFTMFLALRLSQGSTASCRCFGAATRTPLRWTALARNAALALVAAIATTATF